MPTKKAVLEELARQIERCKKCPLWKTRKNVVPGEGPVNAQIMILGQAPGSEENETGRPFVGRAGKLLDQLLKMADIKREKVFITSPIKCFPPKNRKPTKQEIEACLPYLFEQIKSINPRKLVLLGGVAFEVFFRDKQLKNYRGKWLKENNKEYFIAYHPSAGIRFLKFKKILEKDFKKLKENI